MGVWSGERPGIGCAVGLDYLQGLSQQDLRLRSVAVMAARPAAVSLYSGASNHSTGTTASELATGAGTVFSAAQPSLAQSPARPDSKCR